MEQPKFKFGDKVYSTRSVDDSFIVKYIMWGNDSTYWYRRSNTDNFTKESLLVLFREPKKKKLYAYKFHNGEVKFIHSEALAIEYTDFPPVRIHEYDIEYPETK